MNAGSVHKVPRPRLVSATAALDDCWAPRRAIRDDHNPTPKRAAVSWPPASS
jgi:hypothetical protein